MWTGKGQGNRKGEWERERDLGTGNGNGKNINDALLVPRIHHITCLATPVGYMPRRVASRRYNPLASPRRLLLPLFPTSTSFALSCSKHATVNDIRKRPLLLLAACHKLAETDSGDGEGDGGDRQAHWQTVRTVGGRTDGGGYGTGGWATKLLLALVLLLS